MSAPTRGQATSLQAERLLRTLDSTIGRLSEAAPLAKAAHVQEIVRLADLLRREDEGMTGLADRAPALQAAGFFKETPWGRLDRLLATFVSGDLAAGGYHAVMETLSCLRVLAIADGRVKASHEEGGERFGEADARRFLEEVVALNAWALFPAETEQTRGLDPVQIETSERLFRLLVASLPDADLLRLILDEVDAVSAQRPILVDGLFDRIRLAARIAAKHGGRDLRLDHYVAAIDGPGPLSEDSPDEATYLERLRASDLAGLRLEADRCASALAETGLAARQHAWLVRWAGTQESGLLDRALGLGPRGRLERHLNQALTVELIDKAVSGDTAQAVDGLARTLDRGLLSRPEVAGGLRRLLDVTISLEVAKVLQVSAPGVDPKTRLVGGALRVLGRPLGLGQGRNPTCQSARGLSIWSLNRPGYLLELVASAARDGHIRMWFMNDLLDSRDLIGGLMDEMHPELDPVSLVLVPHLDRLYGEMMRRVAHLPEDGHKWVNPAMYGRMVPGAFAAAFDAVTGLPTEVRAFVKRFYMTHHPDHASAHGLVYPNPVGIIVTSAHAAFVGFHAVTIQRIGKDPEGVTRVYFFNPNNEGRQDWGDGIVPSVRDHGEVPGESSLPFDQFAARLYAFHYDPYWMGDAPDDVADEEIDAVMGRIGSSWLATGPWASLMTPAGAGDGA